MRVVHLIHECLFGLGKTFGNGFPWVHWKAALHYYISVKIVTEKISAETATMTVVDAKIGAPWPFFRVYVGSAFGREQICDD